MPAIQEREQKTDPRQLLRSADNNIAKALAMLSDRIAALERRIAALEDETTNGKGRRR